MCADAWCLVLVSLCALLQSKLAVRAAPTVVVEPPDSPPDASVAGGAEARADSSTAATATVVMVGGWATSELDTSSSIGASCRSDG